MKRRISGVPIVHSSAKTRQTAETKTATPGAAVCGKSCDLYGIAGMVS